jgi:hypothetical protein
VCILRTALQLALLKAEKGPLFGLSHRPRQPLFGHLDPALVSCALIWQQLSLSSTPSSQGPEVGGGKRDEDARFVMERCIGGAVEVVPSLRTPQEAAAAACSFLTRVQRQWRWLRGEGEGDLRRKALCHLTVRVEESAELAEVVSRLREAVSATEKEEEEEKEEVRLHPHALVVVTRQPSLDRVQQLQTQRRLCLKNPMSTLIWSPEKEISLNEELRRVASGEACFTFI